MKIIASIVLTIFLFSCGGTTSSNENTKTEAQVVEEMILEIEKDQLELIEDKEKTIAEIDSLLNSI
jgi:hypothetical protein